MLTVKFNDICLDVTDGSIQDKATKALLFASGVNFKRIKPSTKYKKKIGDVWISSSKLAFDYLMAYYMAKNDQKRLAGFYRLDEDKYLVMEFEVSSSPPGVRATCSIHKETPQDYLTIEDKSFDAIFGNTEVSNKTIDFERLYKDVSETFSLGAKVAVAVFLLLFCGLLYYTYLPREQAKPTQIPQDALPPPLTAPEISSLEALVLTALLETFNELAAETGVDKAFNSVTMVTTSSPENVVGHITVRYKSYYPFARAIKEDDHYAWESTFTVEKGRKDIADYIPYKNARTCLGTMIEDNWDVIKRDDDIWHMKLEARKEKDYAGFIRSVNRALGCQVALKRMTLSEGSYICEMDLKT